MSIDWNQLESDLNQAIDQAVKETDDVLAGKASSLTHMTDEEIQRLFPTPVDLKRFQELMSIVQAATRDNSQVVKLEQNIRELSGTVITLLARFV